MKYKKIDTKLFIKNRKNFVNKLERKSIAFFNSNDIYPISADSTLPFDQHRDIFYLSGIDQEESLLVLFPDSKNIEYKDMLFLRETNEYITHWEGEKLTKEQAKNISGINNIFWLSEFEDILKEGDEIEVKLIAIDEKNGKLKLSRKALLPKPEKKD